MIAKFLILHLLFLPALAFGEIGHGAALGDTDFQAAFKKLIAEKNPKAVRSRYLDRMLNVRYRTELYLQAFEKELKTPLPAGKDFSLDEMPSYANLLAVHPVQDSVDDAATALYRNCIEKAWATGTSAEDKKTTLEILSQIYDWIRELPEEDRIMVSDWISDIENMGKDFFDGATKDKKPGGRQVASVIPSFNFAEYNFGNQTNLSKLYKLHKADITKKAAASARWKDSEIDGSIAQFGPPLNKKRGIASPAVFKPDMGPEGTFRGENMGANHYAFTFDDGPQPTNTERIIDIATNYRDSVNTKGVPLTFFWLELWVPKYPTQVEHAKNLGFLINNHSWSHLNFALKKAPPQFHHEIIDANNALKAQFGVQPVIKSDAFPFYRCPYGACVTYNKFRGIPEARRLIAEAGLLHIYWKIDTADWANKTNPERTLAITVAQMEQQGGDHGIILMHDFWPKSPDAFRLILEYIHKRNDNGANITLVPVTTALTTANGAATTAVKVQ